MYATYVSSGARLVLHNTLLPYFHTSVSRQGYHAVPEQMHTVTGMRSVNEDKVGAQRFVSTEMREVYRDQEHTRCDGGGRYRGCNSYSVYYCTFM